MDRRGLLENLLAGDVMARALGEAPSGHKYGRVLTAKMTVVCVLVACLFPGVGYGSVLAATFGLPGLKPKPGAETPTGQHCRRPAGGSASRPQKDLRAGRLGRGRGPEDWAAVKGPGGHGDRRHHDGADQE